MRPRGIDRRNLGKPVQAPGCPERLDAKFLWWVATYRRRSRPRVLAAIAENPQVETYVLRSPRSVRRLLVSLD